MQKIPLSEIINSSQYYRTKPDGYIMQKGIKAAIHRLQSRHRQRLIRAIIIGLLITGVTIVGRWIFHNGFSLGEDISSSNYQSGKTRKDSYIRELEEIFTY